MLLVSNMNESHNTRLGGMKQVILDFKNAFTLSIESLKANTDEIIKSMLVKISLSATKVSLGNAGK